MAPESDTDRKVVKTYVPAYQKESWTDHAEELDMSQSEFVRCMVQAGRRGFEGTDEPSRSADANPRVSVRQDLILEVLQSQEPCDWESLVSEVTQGLEDDIERALNQLLADDVVTQDARGTFHLSKDDR